MKPITLIFGLLWLFSIQIFSQEIGLKKTVFVYKTVKGHEIKANIFLPDSKGLHPVLIYFHGGGFIFGNKDQGLNSMVKEKFLKNGFAVVSPDYRLAPETKLAEIMKDGRDLIQWLRKKGVSKFQIDKDKIYVSGGSAGGYLALSSGFDKQSAPNAIIAISTPTGFSNSGIEMGNLAVLQGPGPYDIVKNTPVSHGNYGSRMQLWRFLARNRLALYEIFGFDPATNTDRLNKFKLDTNIKEGYPPMLLIHARNDRMVPLQEVISLQKHLDSKKVENELYLVEYGHSNELINQNPQVVDKMISFLSAL